MFTKTPKTRALCFLEEAQQSLALELSRKSIAFYVENGKAPVESDFNQTLPEIFDKKFGLFVTLWKQGKLRGCIGNIFPDYSLKEAIMGRSVDVCNDPRFDKLQKNEIEGIQIEIEVLTEPTLIDSVDEIVLGQHGILIHKNKRRAVFLPKVATDYGWSLEETFRNLCYKANLPPDSWKGEGMEISIFEAQIFKEDKNG